MPSFKTYILGILQAALVTLFLYIPSRNRTMSTAPINDWADHPCALVTTPQFATKKVIHNEITSLVSKLI